MADDDNLVHATHELIASELGTAREVVSRILKDFERNGWVKLHRRKILILKPQGLKALSAWLRSPVASAEKLSQ